MPALVKDYDPALWLAEMACVTAATELAWRRTIDTYNVRGVPQMTQSYKDWSELWRCTEGEAGRVAQELHDKNVADVVFLSDDTVTVASRRLTRIHNAREKARLRQQRRRNPEGVTDGELDSSSSSSLVPHDDVLCTWNDMADACPHVRGARSMNPKRKRLLCARWEEKAWRDGWEDAIERIPKSPFLMGDTERASEHRHWKPSIEWFLAPSTVDNILENKYDDANVGAPSSPKCSHCATVIDASGAHVCDRCGKSGLCYGCLYNHDCEDPARD